MDLSKITKRTMGVFLIVSTALGIGFMIAFGSIPEWSIGQTFIYYIQTSLIFLVLSFMFVFGIHMMD